MAQLHEDVNFHYEVIRALGTVPYGGADVAEVLAILPKIKAGDFDSWFDEWFALAERVLSTIDESKISSYSRFTKRSAYFRASHYFFIADFFLHGNPADPRMELCFRLYREYFDMANALLDIPGQAVTIGTSHGFQIPAIIYRASQASASNPRPTLIVGGGFDSNMEETLHVFGFAILERGYNVILYEGPGHSRLLHEQKKGFISDWEKAVSPIVDHIMENKSGQFSFIDTSKIGLIGMSLGGYLAARAAAFEPRLAAVICIDGVYCFEDSYRMGFPECMDAYDQGNVEAFNKEFASMAGRKSTTGKRWMYDQLMYTTRAKTGYEAVKFSATMTMEGIADKIKYPAFIGDAEHDIFFAGQPPRVAEAIGNNVTLVKFGDDQAAGAHCQSGALMYLNSVILDWFAKVIDDKE